MSKLQFVVVKIMNLMEEGGSETVKHFVSEIFVELEQWGLRGDPLLWKDVYKRQIQGFVAPDGHY